MPRKTNPFKEKLEAARAKASSARTVDKPLSEMSEAELDAEAERLRQVARENEEEVVRLQREELVSPAGRRPFPKKRRPPWR